MMLNGTRQALADALTAIPSVTGHPKRPTAPKVGDAWPRLASLTRADGYAFEVAWAVLVVLPSDERSASDWIDANVEALFDALEPVAFVDSMEPTLIQSSGGDVFALQVNARSE